MVKSSGLLYLHLTKRISICFFIHTWARSIAQRPRKELVARARPLLASAMRARVVAPHAHSSPVALFAALSIPKAPLFGTEAHTDRPPLYSRALAVAIAGVRGVCPGAPAT